MTLHFANIGDSRTKNSCFDRIHSNRGPVKKRISRFVAHKKALYFSIVQKLIPS